MVDPLPVAAVRVPECAPLGKQESVDGVQKALRRLSTSRELNFTDISTASAVSFRISSVFSFVRASDKDGAYFQHHFPHFGWSSWAS